jgi:hypothetical protein
VSKRRFAARGDLSPHAFYFLKSRAALERGAAGVILVRNGSDSAHRARRRTLQEQSIKGDAPAPIPDAALTIHISASVAESLARAAGSTLRQWRASAEDEKVGALELPVKLDASIRTSGPRFTSHNVVGIVRGSDARLRAECVVYLGHWDAYGVSRVVNGDSIYNGALDDAAGVSSMLSAARAVKALPRAPRRTMVFVATTAEEAGTLGANAYAANPVCPMARTALAIGMDWTWVWGMTDTISSNGFGYSTVDSLARDIAVRHRKAFVPGVGEYWLASDHAALVYLGVPSWFGGLDGEVVGRPKGWAGAQLASQRTHVPSDDRKPEWNLAGAVFEARYLFELGVRAAESETRASWTGVSEFRRAAERR